MAIAIFVLHCALTAGFWKAIGLANESGNLKQMRVMNVFFFVFVLVMFPVLAYGILENMLVWRNITTEDFIALSSLRTLTFHGMVIRSLGMSVLLIATSMSWYHCFVKKYGQAVFARCSKDYAVALLYYNKGY